jgi:hypothetical protein
MATQFGSSAGSLAEGADRLDRLIRGVKDRQLSEVANVPVPKGVSTAYAVSPEEEWSRKFMTAGIGPMEFKPIQMPVVPIAAPVSAASWKPQPVAASPAPKEVQPAIETPAAAVRPGSIGAVLAKPDRRRSWFGRLVRGT